MGPHVLWIEFDYLPLGQRRIFESPEKELRLASPTIIILRILGVEPFGGRHSVEGSVVLSFVNQDLGQRQMTIGVVWLQLDRTLGFRRRHFDGNAEAAFRACQIHLRANAVRERCWPFQR